MRHLRPLWLLPLFSLLITLPLAAGDANDALLDTAKKAYNQDDFTAARASLTKLLAAKPADAQRDAANLYLACMLEEEDRAAEALKQFDVLATGETTDKTIAFEARLLWCRASLEHNLADQNFRKKLEQLRPDDVSPRLKALSVLEICRFFAATRQMELIMDGRGELLQNRDAVTDPNDRAHFDLFIALTYARSATDSDLLKRNADIFAAEGVKPSLKMRAALTLAGAAMAAETPQIALDWMTKAAKLPHPLPHRLADVMRYTAIAQSALGNATAAFTALTQGRAIPNLPANKVAELWLAEASVALDQGDVGRAQNSADAALKLGGLNAAAQVGAKNIQKIVVGQPVPKLLFDPATPDLQTAWFHQWLGAIKRDDAAAIKKLASQGIDPAAILDPKKTTGLSLSAGMGRAKAVQALLDLKVPVDPRDDDQRTPLMQAAQAGREAVVRMLAAKNADINAKDKYNITALHMAASMGHLPVVKFLLAQKMDVNILGENSWTPLHCAANYQQLEVVQYLVEHGANINARSDRDETAMLLSTKRNDSEVTRYLANVKAPAGPAGQRPVKPATQNPQADLDLVSAAMSGTAADAAKALAAGADINTTAGEIPRTPLIWAARQGNLEVLKLLIDKGADVNQMDGLMSKTALDLANLRHNQEMIEYLKSKHAKTANELK